MKGLGLHTIYKSQMPLETLILIESLVGANAAWRKQLAKVKSHLIKINFAISLDVVIFQASVMTILKCHCAFASAAKSAQKLTSKQDNWMSKRRWMREGEGETAEKLVPKETTAQKSRKLRMSNNLNCSDVASVQTTFYLIDYRDACTDNPFCRFSSVEGKSKTAKLETEQIYGHCRKFQISVSFTRSTMWNCNQHRLYNEISVCRHSPDNSWQQRKGKPVRFLNFFFVEFQHVISTINSASLARCKGWTAVFKSSTI